MRGERIIKAKWVCKVKWQTKPFEMEPSQNLGKQLQREKKRIYSWRLVREFLTLWGPKRKPELWRGTWESPVSWKRKAPFSLSLSLYGSLRSFRTITSDLQSFEKKASEVQFRSHSSLLPSLLPVFSRQAITHMSSNTTLVANLRFNDSWRSWSASNRTNSASWNRGFTISSKVI